MTFSVLGKDGNNNDVQIYQKERREGTYVLGATGTGKSTLLSSLILQDINQGIGVCVLDPHGDLVNDVLSRMNKRLEDVILIDLGDKNCVAGLNLFHCENPNDPFEAENIIQGVMHILEKVYQIDRETPLLNQYFINITKTLIYNPHATVLDIPRMLTDWSFRASLVANVPDEDVRWFWTEFFEKHRKGMRLDDVISAVSNKLVEFNSRVLKPWFGQKTQTINMRRIMDERKILLVKLKARWSSINSLIGSILIAQILDAAYSRENIRTNKRKQFNVYSDEFQTYASLDFAQLFSEARKYGIGITISHQVFEQLDDTIKATIKQAATICVFRVSSDNAKEIAGAFDCSPIPGLPRYEMLRTPVKEPIQHMLTKGIHPLPTVGEFLNQYGKMLIEGAKQEENAERQAYVGIDPMGLTLSPPAVLPETSLPGSPQRFCRYTLIWLNDLFHQAMMAGKEGRSPDDIEILDSVVSYFIRATHTKGLTYLTAIDEYAWYVSNTSQTPITHYNSRMWELRNILNNIPSQAQERISALYHNRDRIMEQLQRANNTYLRLLTLSRIPSQAVEQAHQPIFQLQYELEQAQGDIRYLPAQIKDEMLQQVQPLREELALLERIENNRFEYERSLRNIKAMLHEVMRDLAVAPIEADSGLMQEVPTEIPSTEVESRIANQIKLLPRYTARVRTEAGEYTIQTVKPNEGINEVALKQCVADIQQRNLATGYLRLRKEVDQEIAARYIPAPQPKVASKPMQQPTQPMQSAPRKKKII